MQDDTNDTPATDETEALEAAVLEAPVEDAAEAQPLRTPELTVY